MPDQAAAAPGVQAAGHHGLHRRGLVLAQDVFVQLFVLLGKDDEVLEQAQQVLPVAEGFDFVLQATDLLAFPVEEIAAQGVPGDPVGKADGLGEGDLSR
jgi:hypothetical protein